MPQPTINPLPTAPSRQRPDDFQDEGDALMAALAGFVTQANALGDYMYKSVALAVSAESTTSIAIGTGAKSITVQAGKAMVVGMSVKIASTADPTQWMHGDVTAYDSGTGALTVNVTTVSGSGTYADWQVSLSAPNAQQSGFQSMQVFTSSGTWTKPAGITKVMVYVTGGGGGGGQGTDYYRGGGGAGGTAKKFIDVSAISSETVTIGGGGGQSANGGTSSFGAHCSALGGDGAASGSGRDNGGSGGAALGGDINIIGGSGNGAGSYVTVVGGASFWGGGGKGCFNAPAESGRAYGSGGGGSLGYTAGSGKAGVVVVFEYK